MHLVRTPHASRSQHSDQHEIREERMMEDKPRHMESDNVTIDFRSSRRDFLKVTGGGLIIFVSAGVLPAQERAPRRGGQDLPTDFNAFLKVGADGRVSCFTGKAELGQGVITSLAQMLADELDVPLDRVDMVTVSYT